MADSFEVFREVAYIACPAGRGWWSGSGHESKILSQKKRSPPLGAVTGGSRDCLRQQTSFEDAGSEFDHFPITFECFSCINRLPLPPFALSSPSRPAASQHAAVRGDALKSSPSSQIMKFSRWLRVSGSIWFRFVISNAIEF